MLTLAKRRMEYAVIPDVPLNLHYPLSFQLLMNL